MSARRIGVAEARKLLPELVETIGTQGGRVDITRRGEARVSIVRTIDLSEERDRGGASALHVEFAFPPEDLVDVLRDLRSRTGRVRRIEAQADCTRPRVRRKHTAGKSKS